jgi:hypothetical protein
MTINDDGNIVATKFTGNLVGNADSATKVSKSLIIKLNSGTTEGTNLFTFDGSAGKTVNITPSAIGINAASASLGLVKTGGDVTI